MVLSEKTRCSEGELNESLLHFATMLCFSEKCHCNPEVETGLAAFQLLNSFKYWKISNILESRVHGRYAQPLWTKLNLAVCQVSMSMKLLLLPIITASAGAGLGFFPSGKERNLQQATGDETKGHLEIQTFYQTSVDPPHETILGSKSLG